jgi:protein involved in polysaccharide export with SLBB domain
MTRLRILRSSSLKAATLMVLAGWAPIVVAQTPPVPEARLDTRRAQATRQELQETLTRIDSILGSPGYSSRIRDAKKRESALIRDRITEGDLQVGDQVILTVQGEQAFTGTFLVGAGRVLSLPSTPDIPLRGILRSEAQDYITEELKRYVRDPSVRVQTLIRMGILGAVGKQGFYQVPADVLVSDAIMIAGGPAGNADPNRTVIRRGGNVILTEEDVRGAIVNGATLDQLNLRAGDEISVDPKIIQRSKTITILTVTTLLTTTLYFLTYLLGRNR